MGGCQKDSSMWTIVTPFSCPYTSGGGGTWDYTLYGPRLQDIIAAREVVVPECSVLLRNVSRDIRAGERLTVRERKEQGGR